jgi:endogenous inhibitor of DNA gyrase (YacG/DUF329 family)
MQGQGPAEWPEFPFCSARCRLIDLGRWLGERNGIPLPAGADDLTEQPETQDTP